MKQKIVLIGLVFAMLTAYAQNDNSATATTAPADTAKVKDYCPHRIWVDFGTAYSNDIYNRFDNIKQKYALGNVLEVGYSYFFHPKMGVGLGVGISKISAKALLNNGGSIPIVDTNYTKDPNAGVYEMFFDCDKFSERQNIWAIEVPLTFQFEHKMGEAKRNGIFASLGVKGYFPISARTSFPGGDLSFSGYDPYLNVVWPKDMPVHFEPATMGESFVKTKLRPSVDLIGDFGGLFGLTKTTDLYIGIYASYGFMDILPKSEDKVTYIQKEGNKVPTISGMLNSNMLDVYNTLPDNDISTKWNLFQAGVKVGFRFKTCGQNSQSMRESKREFMDKYEDRLDKAGKKGRGDDDGDGGGKKGKKGGESVYIIPIYVGGSGSGKDGDFSGFDDADMDSEVGQLMRALTNARFYFDLDKDIPKNPKNQYVDEAATILKNNPNIKINLGGYTCKLGTHQHNEGLAERRANRIKDMFVTRGVDPKQIETEAFTAEDYPAGMFPSLEDARTVIIKISKKQQ